MFTNTFKTHMERLPEELSQKGYIVVDNVFDQESLKQVILNFEAKREGFRPASIGKGTSKVQEDEIRNDSIIWLEQGEEGFKPVWNLLDEAMVSIKQGLYLPLKRYEVQLALYSKGHFYKKHVDRHKLSPSRLISMVLYFNDWVKEDAGELMIYKADGAEVQVEPVANRAVFFLSELEHQVLTVNKERRSLTAWFRDDID